MRALTSVLLAAVLAAACTRARPPAAAGPLGLWVLAEGSERTLESPEKIASLVDRAAQLGASDLFVQVHRAGRSWFPSTHADDAPFRAMRAAHPNGPEPLADLIARAHARGLRVHAWFNCLALAQNRDAPVLRAVGRDAVQVDRAGRSLLDYPADGKVPPPDGDYYELDAPGLWLDPAVPGVVDFLAATVDDLVHAAPDLDGLHLDYIRYPYALPMIPGSRFRGLDFGYGEIAKTRFAAESGAFATGDAWDEFRRARVGELVDRLHARIPKQWQLSAAVLAFADRAYLTSLQDWRAWLEEGRIDFAVAMAYTRDDRLFRYHAHALRFGIGGDRVWLGIGAWLAVEDPARIQHQLELAREVKPAGVALFSWDALAGKPAALAELERP
ncbi:MAG TPA: family 10 glycosylhydrolase [Myxococcota bacterium]|nr:family 10 glycosylhydrolase [Myxococcota bacterium]